MGLSTAYLTQVKNLKAILEGVRNAQAPSKFSTRFLRDLGYASTNDRPTIGVFKALGLVDETGVPTDTYYAYLDETQSAKVLAGAIREAYSDLFGVNSNAHQMTQSEVKQKLKTLTRGEKSETVLNKMARTFVSLCEQGDFEPRARPRANAIKPQPTAPAEEQEGAPAKVGHAKEGGLGLVYNINIELPATRDQAVYDAIFRSLREHIL